MLLLQYPKQDYSLRFLSDWCGRGAHHSYYDDLEIVSCKYTRVTAGINRCLRLTY